MARLVAEGEGENLMRLRWFGVVPVASLLVAAVERAAVRLFERGI